MLLMLSRGTIFIHLHKYQSRQVTRQTIDNKISKPPATLADPSLSGQLISAPVSRSSAVSAKSKPKSQLVIDFNILYN